ncbi:MAG: hypothetical protein J5685_11290 [Clostridiales bacterium]|nr:hypothetical protein [Clostridiales bacterium]
MIEYFPLMHKGGAEEYFDSLILNFSGNLTAFLYYGSSERNVSSGTREKKAAADIINNCKDIPFEEVSKSIASVMNDSSEYMVIRISDSKVESDCRGKVNGYLLKKGEIKRLPNGMIRPDVDDRIVVGTAAFYKKLSLPAILADSMVSISAEEWMDNMICRISEKTMLAEGNLTALTLMVRAEDIRV